MHADLDSLLTALYVFVDDLLPARSGAGRRPRITDAELIALAVAQILLDCHSERRFLRFVRQRLGHLFPYVPKQPGYNKRLRSLSPKICLVIQQLARVSPSFNDRLRLLDSTPVPCGAPRDRPSSARNWQAGPPTATAPATAASSGGCGCICCAPRTGCPSTSAWPRRTRVSAKSPRACSNAHARRECSKAERSSRPTRASPGRSSSKPSPPLTPRSSPPRPQGREAQVRQARRHAPVDRVGL